MGEVKGDYATDGEGRKLLKEEKRYRCGCGHREGMLLRHGMVRNGMSGVP